MQPTVASATHCPSVQIHSVSSLILVLIHLLIHLSTHLSLIIPALVIHHSFTLSL